MAWCRRSAAAWVKVLMTNDARERTGSLVRSDSMAIEWSGLSPELLVRLDRSAGRPLRSQLETGLRDAIRSGRLRGGGTAAVLP